MEQGAVGSSRGLLSNTPQAPANPASTTANSASQRITGSSRRRGVSLRPEHSADPLPNHRAKEIYP
jgi:hypothetical protein